MNPLGKGNIPQQGNNPINALLNFMNGGGNPQQLIQQIQQNPQANAMVQQLQSMGKSPKEMVMQIAKQRGIDPTQIEQLVQKMGHK